MLFNRTCQHCKRVFKSKKPRARTCLPCQKQIKINNGKRVNELHRVKNYGKDQFVQVRAKITKHVFDRTGDAEIEEQMFRSELSRMLNAFIDIGENGPCRSLKNDPIYPELVKMYSVN